MEPIKRKLNLAPSTVKRLKALEEVSDKVIQVLQDKKDEFINSKILESLKELNIPIDGELSKFYKERITEVSVLNMGADNTTEFILDYNPRKNTGDFLLGITEKIPATGPEIKDTTFKHSAEILIAEYSSSRILTPVIKGDKIVVDGYTTEVEKVEYCNYAKMHLYYYRNEYGQLKFNLLDFIKKL